MTPLRVRQERRMSNVGKVERIYHALSRGDFRAVLPWLAEGVAWDVWESNMAQAAGVSHLQPRKGPLGVLQYFQILARWEVREFRVVSLMEGGNQVAAEVVFEARLPGG
ncbi:MAG: nuclear transport factor 2 family protein, partial [SAR202 cluster bacterium]|nr:nuclear transport factor 2 family protein [SAR202 cluster bacterium]